MMKSVAWVHHGYGGSRMSRSLTFNSRLPTESSEESLRGSLPDRLSGPGNYGVSFMFSRIISSRAIRLIPLLGGLLYATSFVASAEDELAFERTEVRETCDHYTPTKQVFFGETHIHTGYSMDAVNLDTRIMPADAYMYARGQGAVGLPPWADTRDNLGDPDLQCTPGDDDPSKVAQRPYGLPGDRCQYTASRTAQKLPARALDFAAITDHAEQFGEANICYFESYETCEEDNDCSVAGQRCFSGKCAPLGWDSNICMLAREELSRLRLGAVPGLFALLENGAANPARYTQVCRPNGADLLPVGFRGANCEFNAVRVWDQIQADAEAAYDRSSACEFTSFVAYEYTAMANGGRCSEDYYSCWSDVDCNGNQTCQPIESGGMDNLHRNIIFRNASVLESPISNVDQPTGCGEGEKCLPQNKGVVGSPVNMLKRLADRCHSESMINPGCEFISIPHNPNISGGGQFQPLQHFDDDVISPAQKEEEAVIRGTYEPLAEIMQIKGQSECRYESKTGEWWGVGLTDEYDALCDFENLDFGRLNGDYIPDPSPDDFSQSLPRRSYLRNVLSFGLQYLDGNPDQMNPFKLGFVGGLDNHSGLPGQSNEQEYARLGAHGVNSFAVSSQALADTSFLGIDTNPGGLTAVWAEENSRDSIFNAMQSRETYATSGTRPSVRFFGGFDIPSNMCRKSNFAARGYRGGVPMGSTLNPADMDHSKEKPRFAVLASWDPGWTGRPGTRLQRMQIIKGWVDAEGEIHEKVIDYDDFDRGKTGHAKMRGANPDTCRPTRAGFKTLCGVWTDPDFDADEQAFYYARVLEQPSCRWNQYYCNAKQVQCDQPMGTCEAESRRHPHQGKACYSLDDCGEGSICKLPNSYTAWEYQQCCDDLAPALQQERAWTSPIWYEP